MGRRSCPVLLVSALLTSGSADAGIIQPPFQQSSSSSTGGRIYPTAETGSFPITADMCGTNVTYNGAAPGTATATSNALPAGCEVRFTQMGAKENTLSVVGSGSFVVSGYDDGSGPISKTAGRYAGVHLKVYDTATQAVLFNSD